MQTNNTIIPASPRFRGEILNRVYRVWLFRRLAPVVVAEVAALVLLLWRLARLIFLRRVAENALNVFSAHPYGLIAFFVSAFEHASLATQIVLVAALVALAFLIRHVTQGILRFILVRENYFSRVRPS